MAEPILRHAAAHVLHRDELTLSHRLLDQTDEVDRYLLSYFGAARSSSRKRAAIFTGGEVSDRCSSALASGEALLEASQLLAKRLFALVSGDMRISLSVLLMCAFDDPEEGAQIGVFKLDPSDGLRPKVHEDRGGVTVVEFEITKDVMPTSREALQKSAIIPDASSSSSEYDLFVVDSQSRGQAVAQFFLVDFLQAEYALTDAERTNRFVRAVTRAKNTLGPNVPPAEILSIDAGLRAALRSDHVSAEHFVDQLAVSDESSGVLRTELEEQLPDWDFDVDHGVAERALRKKIFKGDHGLKVEVPANHFEDLIDITMADDGRRVITITTQKWDEQG